MMGHRRNLMTINLLNDLECDLDMFRIMTFTNLLFKTLGGLRLRHVTAVVIDWCKYSHSETSFS